MIHSPLTNPGDVIRLNAGGTAFGILHIVIAILLVLCVATWGRHAGRRLIAAAGSLGVAAVLLVYFVALRNVEIPIDWITVLQHGFERKAISQLYTEGVHAGEAFHAVVRAAAGFPPTLHDVVRLNLLLSVLNAIIFLCFAIRIAGPAWALPWTLSFSLNPAMFLASFSELPAHMLTLYFLAGVIGWAVLTDTRPQSRVIRGAAYLFCAILTVLTALTRLEVAVIGGIALALFATHAAMGEARWTALSNRLQKVLDRAISYFGDRPVTVAVLCAVGVIIGYTGIPGVVGRSQLAAFYPFDATIFSLYIYLPLLMLPVGAVLGILFGSIEIIRSFRKFGGIALSLLLILRMYFTSWSEYFEMGRYLSNALAAVFVVGLIGQAAFAEATRGWTLRTARAARILYLMTWFTLPLPGVAEYYRRVEFHPERGISELLLDRDTQTEVRQLLTMTERNPECVFVARAINDDGSRDLRENPQYEYIAFGKPLTQAFTVPEAGTRVADFISEHAVPGSCVRLYFGGDCNMTFTDGCKEFIAGHRLIEERRFPSRPYSDPRQSGHGGAELVLATYSWP